MLVHGLVALLALAPRVTALGILLPLYVYPNTGCAAWSAVNSAISAHSSTPWYLIVNPDNGPGETDTLYQNCVASLASASTRITLGYIDSSSGNVENDIDTYASWPSNARPNGIYFDDVSPTSSELSTYQSYVSYARNKGFSFIALGPGESVSDSYLSLADMTITYEDTYSGFKTSSMTGSMGKQAVNLEQAPSSGSYIVIIDQLESMGVMAVYITNEPDTSNALPVQLSPFAAGVASSNGRTSSTGGTGSGGGSPGGEVSGASSSNSDGSSNPTSGATGASGSLPAGTGTKSTGTTGAVDGIATSGSSSGSNSGSGSGSGSNSDSGSGAGPVAGASGHHPSAAVIVGAVLGTLVVLLGLLVAALCLRRRRQRHNPFAADPFTEIRQQPMIDTTSIMGAPGSDAAAFSSSSAPASPQVVRSMVASTIGTGIPPSRAWAADLKNPLPEDACTSESDREEGLSLPPIPDSPTLHPNFSTAPNRLSHLSAFSSYTNGSAGTMVPMYSGPPSPEAHRASLAPPPAYNG